MTKEEINYWLKEFRDNKHAYVSRVRLNKRWTNRKGGKMKKYDEINFKGLDWYVLDTNEETTKLLLKNVLDEERIKKYSDDDFMINGSSVRHQDTIRPFDWNKSYIKNTILPNFIKDLGIECEATLLTKDEVEELPDEIRKCNDWYWTKTPYPSGAELAWNVTNGGHVYHWYGVGLASSVRPVLNLNSSQFTTENARGTTCREEIDFIDIEELTR